MNNVIENIQMDEGDVIMFAYVKYFHPITNNSYYLADWKCVNDELRPVGCFGYRKDHAIRFLTKSDALKVAGFLESLGYRVCVLSRV